LTLFFHGVFDERILPRFLIHDGLYNGVDKSQFVSTMNILNDFSKKYRFQYIFTANEDDIWIDKSKSEQYGVLDIDLNEMSVAEYSESSKIFNRDY